MNLRKYSSVIKNITLISQFGLSLVTPLLICLFLCVFLCNKTGVGAWIYIPGFILGLGSSAASFYKLYQTVVSGEKKNEKNKVRASFNRHI